MNYSNSKQPTMPGLSSFPVKEIHDGFAFTPCGFSSNSINESNYYTIHVTQNQVGVMHHLKLI